MHLAPEKHRTTRN